MSTFFDLTEAIRKAQTNADDHLALIKQIRAMLGIPTEEDILKANQDYMKMLEQNPYYEESLLSVSRPPEARK